MIQAAVFSKDVLARFAYYKQLADTTIGRLSDAQLCWKPSNESNSIAIIGRHMAGNMLSRFTNFLTEDGEKPWRMRDEEFEEQSFLRTAWWQQWEQGWQLVFDTVASLTDEQLLHTVTIRNEPFRAYDAVLRQLAHYSYHVGQIVLLGKMMLDEDWQSLSIPKKKGA
jgi:Protein of unknown function (DUF1572)